MRRCLVTRYGHNTRSPSGTCLRPGIQGDQWQQPLCYNISVLFQHCQSSWCLHTTSISDIGNHQKHNTPPKRSNRPWSTAYLQNILQLKQLLDSFQFSCFTCPYHWFIFNCFNFLVFCKTTVKILYVGNSVPMAKCWGPAVSVPDIISNCFQAPNNWLLLLSYDPYKLYWPDMGEFNIGLKMDSFWLQFSVTW